jgi:hypothetical protein
MKTEDSFFLNAVPRLLSARKPHLSRILHLDAWNIPEIVSSMCGRFKMPIGTGFHQRRHQLDCPFNSTAGDSLVPNTPNHTFNEPKPRREPGQQPTFHWTG